MLTEPTCLCAFTNYSAEWTLYFLFSATPGSPSETAGLDGLYLHQLSSQEQFLLLYHLSGSWYGMSKDPFCWGWSPQGRASSLVQVFKARLPYYKVQSKMQPDLWLCRGQCNEQRAVAIFLWESELLEAKWESLDQSQTKLDLEEKLLIGPGIYCPAQKPQVCIAMAYPTTDGGKYKLVARCRWKEVPQGAAWVPSSSKAPGGAMYMSWRALSASLTTEPRLKKSLKYLC